MSDATPSPADDDATPDVRLQAALVRTLFASERTLMAWIRTSLSLVAFGFAVAQFFQYLAERESTTRTLEPRVLGGALVVVGIVLLLLALIEHLAERRHLLAQKLTKDLPSNLPVGSAIGLLAVGTLAFVSIVLDWSL